MVTRQKSVRIHGENIGRSLRKRYVEASEPSWDETGQHFHLQMRPKRFTPKHAKDAGYIKRKANYTKRKFKKFGHRNPLQWSGELKRQVQTANIKARSGTGRLGGQGGVSLTYRARVFNVRNPNTKINMADEFRRITDRESSLLGLYFQTRFESRFYASN